MSYLRSAVITRAARLRKATHLLLPALAVLALCTVIRIASTSISSSTGAQKNEPMTLSLNVTRRGHTATALTDGRVIVIGGQNQAGAVSEAEIIDPEKATVSVIATLVPRFNHTATLLPDGRVFIIGGSNAKGPLNSTEIFDPQTSQSSDGPRLTRARAGHSATQLNDGRILIVGGRADGSAEVFDANIGRFTLLKPTLNGPRSLHGAALLRNGDVLIVGGEGPDGQPLDTAELFKTRRESFYPISTWMYSARVRPDMRVLPDGKVQVIGGDKSGTMEMYDPAGKYFRGFVDIASAANSLPISSLLQAQTRAAFIDHDKSKDRQSTVQTYDAAVAEQAPVGSENTLFRDGYTSTEITARNLAVIAGGKDENDQFVKEVTVTRSVPAFVTTDQIDYPPEGRPVISGGGWPGNEKIVIHRLETKTGNVTSFRAVADNYGNFFNSDLVPEDHQVGSYALTAVGESSGYVAQTLYRRGPALDPQKAGKPPTRVKFNIPLSGEGEGTVQTYAGPFKYKINRLRDIMKDGGMRPAARVDLPTVDVSWNDVGVSFPAPLPPLAWSTSGHVLFNGYIEATVDLDFGCPPNPICCACELFSDDCDSVCDPCPCGGRLGDLKVTLKLVANFDSAITNEFTLAGTVIKNDIVLMPMAHLDIPPAQAGGVGFRVDLSMIGGIKFGFKDPMKFETCLSMGANTTTSLSAGISSGFQSSFDISNQHASAGFEMKQLGNTCLELSVGPGMVGQIYTEECDPLVSLNTRPVAGFIEGCLNANNVDPNCQTYNIDINGGLKADFRIPIGCGLLAVSPINLEHQYFKQNIASFDLGIFKDLLPPVISAPGDFTYPSDPGQCSAAVTYSASALDYCSGVKSFQCSPPSGAVFPKGTTTVTCTATDNAGRQQACTNPSFNGNTSTRSFSVTIADAEPPKLTGVCPGNIVKATEPGKCSAIATFTPPTASDNCPGVTVACVPQSGFAFSKGVTAVTCTAADAANNRTSCSFTVTVNDTEAPSITCPSKVTAVTPVQGAPTAAVTYAAPTGSDNCPGLTFACVPPSGSVFNVGTTTVSCTATDAAGNHTSCQFTVSLFNVCLQDDSNPNNVLLFKTNGAEKGQYRYCCNGTSYTGVGTIIQRGDTFTLSHIAPDRRVQAGINSDGAGVASLQYPPGTTINTITDKAFIGVHTCICGPGGT